MTDEELIERLRWRKESLDAAAADRIEALATALRLLQTDGLHIKHARRAERLEKALHWYSEDPSSQGDVARAALKGDKP